MALYRASITAAVILGSLAIAVSSATAQKRYDPGASDTEIKIGNTMPYSGPASNVGTVGRAEAAYFQMRNEHGGVNGRRITFISLDDGYNPAKIFEQVRKLVEQEHVLAIFGIIGTPTAAAVQRYLNNNKVPQLFGQSGAARFADPQHYPWTTPITPGYADEARVYAKYILETRPQAKVGILYQNDDYGKSYLTGLKEGFGSRPTKLIEAAYEASDPTVASQIVSLQAAGVDVLFTTAIPKFSAQAIRKVYELGWKPLHVMAYPGASIPTVLAGGA
jgi:branched-chain amino acid transport system substrate-binding protein